MDSKIVEAKYKLENSRQHQLQAPAGLLMVLLSCKSRNASEYLDLESYISMQTRFLMNGDRPFTFEFAVRFFGFLKQSNTPANTSCHVTTLSERGFSLH
jgi:hypothetical protein